MSMTGCGLNREDGTSGKNQKFSDFYIWISSPWQRYFRVHKRIKKMCVYRSLEGEYDYQSWSVKGIPGIVRDKGILGSTKGLRKCVFSEAWRGIWLSKLISEGNSWDCPWQRHINADWSPVNANTGTNFYLGLIVKQTGTIIVL